MSLQHPTPKIGRCSRLVIAFLCGLSAWSSRGAEEEPKEVKPLAAEIRTAPARAGALPLTLQVLGRIAPPRQMPATVNALTAGVVTRVNVRDGQQVTSGTVLLSFDARTIQAELAKARSDVALAEKELSYAEQNGLLQEQEELELAAAQARVKAQQAQKESERTAALLAKSLISEKAATEARQEAETSRKEAQAAQRKAEVFHQSGRGLEVDRLKAKLAEAQSALRLQELELEAATAKAPVAGRVTRVHVVPGQAVEKGAALVEMEASQGIGVSFALPPGQARQVRPAMKFKLTDDLALRTCQGVITSVGGGVDPDSGLVRVEGLLDGGNGAPPFQGEILPGAITTEMSPRGLIVPLGALSVNDEGTYVHVIDGEHKARQKSVEVLTRTAGEAVIKTGEIKPGQKVVADGNYNLPDGALVSEKGEPSSTQEKGKDEKDVTDRKEEKVAAEGKKIAPAPLEETARIKAPTKEKADQAERKAATGKAEKGKPQARGNAAAAQVAEGKTKGQAGGKKAGAKDAAGKTDVKETKTKK